MLGCDMLTLDSGIYRDRGEVLTPPQSSPESHHSHVNSSRGRSADGPEICLPGNIPDILLCKFALPFFTCFLIRGF